MFAIIYRVYIHDIISTMLGTRVCVYIYIYVYMCIYIYIYMYIYTMCERERDRYSENNSRSITDNIEKALQ